MLEIEVTKGRHKLMMYYSEEDYEIVNSHKWTLIDGLYAGTRIKVDGKIKLVRCHRLLMNITDPNLVVDHINGDTLDNRRENLRIASFKENSRNTVQVRNRHGYKGVGKEDKYFIAAINVDGKPIRKGRFKTPEEAAKLYDIMALHFFGDFAKLNFPDSLPEISYIEWLSNHQRYLEEKESRLNSLRIVHLNIINEIIDSYGYIDSTLIGDYNNKHNIDVNLKRKLMVRLNKMVKLNQLRVEKIIIYNNLEINRYYRK